MSSLKPVITVKIGNYPLPVYRLRDGRRGVINTLDDCLNDCPQIVSIDQGICRWLKQAQDGNQKCIEFISECLQDALGTSEGHWKYLKAQDILERALANEENAIRELQYYLLEAIDNIINEYNWLKDIEDLQEVIREKDEKIAELEREIADQRDQIFDLENPL